MKTSFLQTKTLKMESRVFATLAMKLGIKSDPIIRRAEEFARLADIRSATSSMSSLGLTGSCKAVMCLQLAASDMGEPIERATVLRVSGMKNKKVYQGGLRAMQCLLDLQPKCSIQDLAIQFGCTTAKGLACAVIKRYEHDQKSDTSEFSQVLFNAAALCAACKKQKVKIDRKRLVDTAGVTKATFDRLVAEMTKAAEAITSEEKNKAGGKRTKTFLEDLEMIADEQGSPGKMTRRDQTGQEEEVEAYEVWKTRILMEAYKALGKTCTPKS